LTEQHPVPRAEGRSGADLWFLYTGGTTGTPKAVMWDHAALVGVTETYSAGLGLEPPRTAEHASRNVAEIHERGKVIRLGIAAPLIHGTANFTSQAIHLQGGCVVMLEAHSFDAVEQLRSIERDRITNLVSAMTQHGRRVAAQAPIPGATPGTGTSARHGGRPA